MLIAYMVNIIFNKGNFGISFLSYTFCLQMQLIALNYSEHTLFLYVPLFAYTNGKWNNNIIVMFQSLIPYIGI